MVHMHLEHSTDEFFDLQECPVCQKPVPQSDPKFLMVEMLGHLEEISLSLLQDAEEEDFPEETGSPDLKVVTSPAPPSLGDSILAFSRRSPLWQYSPFYSSSMTENVPGGEGAILDDPSLVQYEKATSEVTQQTVPSGPFRNVFSMKDAFPIPLNSVQEGFGFVEADDGFWTSDVAIPPIIPEEPDHVYLQETVGLRAAGSASYQRATNNGLEDPEVTKLPDSADHGIRELPEMHPGSDQLWGTKIHHRSSSRILPSSFRNLVSPFMSNVGSSRKQPDSDDEAKKWTGD
jgi:hypothetical protein